VPADLTLRPGSLRLATLNVNGIRASVQRGFRTWWDRARPDVLALQETRCVDELVPTAARPGTHHWLHHSGAIRGRNGVALITSVAPAAVRYGFGSREFDHEGRWIEADLDLAPGPDGTPRRLTVASLYLPKGGTPYEDEASLAKYERKLRFCRALARHLTKARRIAADQGREFVVMGDWNIAPDERDVASARTKRRSEGFLPAEREWIASILGPRRLVDVVRLLHGDAQGPYTWWSWRGRSWNNDAGWRIDHQLATGGLARRAIGGGTDREATYEARLSDHSAVVVDYEW